MFLIEIALFAQKAVQRSQISSVHADVKVLFRQILKLILMNVEHILSRIGSMESHLHLLRSKRSL